jgi:hypothetical protein
MLPHSGGWRTWTLVSLAQRCVRSGRAFLQSRRMLFPERFADQTIMFIQSTHEIYDDRIRPVKPHVPIVIGFCSDPSQTPDIRTSLVKQSQY